MPIWTDHFPKRGFLKCIRSFCNILRWNIGESGLETCCNKDSNDLFDQLFLLLWIREWYFPTCFQPNRRLRAKNSRAGAEKHGRRKIWKKCKGREIKRGSTWGQCGCHQRRKSAITVMVTDSVQWTRHTSSAIGKMTPAPVWNPWSFHLRELDAFIKRNYVVITHTSWHCYSRFVKKYLLSWWCQCSN